MISLLFFAPATFAGRCPSGSGEVSGRRWESARRSRHVLGPPVFVGDHDEEGARELQLLGVSHQLLCDEAGLVPRADLRGHVQRVAPSRLVGHLGDVREPGLSQSGVIT